MGLVVRFRYVARELIIGNVNIDMYLFTEVCAYMHAPSIIKVLCLGIRHEKPRLLKITVSSESEKYLNPKKHFKAT